MKEVQSYKCEICNQIYKSKQEAAECEFKHKRCQYANVLLENKYSLDAINHYCGFCWPLEALKGYPIINKDSRFKDSSYQCCDDYIYKIEEILEDGKLRLAGCPLGGEYYSFVKSVQQLPKPFIKEEE